MEKKLKKLFIVIEDTGLNNGNGFNVYLEGDTFGLEGKKISECSPAEVWGTKLFDICIQVLEQAGVIQTETKRDQPLGGKH